MRRVLIVVCILTQIIVSFAAAEEMTVRGNRNRNYQTLEGMPLPDSVPVVGTLKGFIQTSAGLPLAGGNVLFFNDATGPYPAPEKYWRVADKIASLDNNGGFAVELPPGRYYVGAIQRKGDKSMIGPPAEGDIFYAGKNKYEVLPASEKNLDVLRGAKLFAKSIIAPGAGATVIEGSVIDISGKPVENAMVFAHVKKEMNDRPLFVSDRTDKNGVYRLRVAGAGTYFLRVRDVYGGGMPAAGSLMGVYGGNNPQAVVVKDGEILKGINLAEVEFVTPLRKSKEKGGPLGMAPVVKP